MVVAVVVIVVVVVVAFVFAITETKQRGSFHCYYDLVIHRWIIKDSYNRLQINSNSNTLKYKVSL